MTDDVLALARIVANETTAMASLACAALAGDSDAQQIMADYAADLAAEGGEHIPNA